jgi:Na+-transporting NADH:ubiquinone oxidoreductase subunit NqrF
VSVITKKIKQKLLNFLLHKYVSLKFIPKGKGHINQCLLHIVKVLSKSYKKKKKHYSRVQREGWNSSGEQIFDRKHGKEKA